jgi:hypothetical protein
MLFAACLLFGGVVIAEACGLFASLNPCWRPSGECRPLGVALQHILIGALCLLESYYLMLLLIRRHPSKNVSPKGLGIVGLCLIVAAIYTFIGNWLRVF